MKRKLRLKLLTDEEVRNLYDKCLYFLSSKGVKVDHPDALRILHKAGAEIDFDDRKVRFPRDVMEMAFRTVPHSITLAGSNTRHDIVIPHPSGWFYGRNGTGATSYIDPDSNTYRETTLADVAELSQLVERLDEISICAFPTPMDIPHHTADIYATKTLFENTAKHLMVQPYSLESVEYLIQLAIVVAGSTDSLRERPLIHLIPGPITPFYFSHNDIGIIIEAARYGVPISVASLPSAGGTAPVTIAGTILVSGIEILAMTVISQLVKPGTPVIAIPLYFALDMLTGSNLQSSVESILGSAATVQFIKDVLDIPTHTYGFGTDSYIVDGQSMIDTTQRGLLVSLAGSDILGGAGQVNVATAISPVQLIIDNTQASVLKRVILGIQMDDETLAWEEVLNTVPGGNFLDIEHTVRHCREALRPKLLTRPPDEVWISGGCKDLYTRAVENYQELKKKLEPQQLPEEVRREMNRIVRRADERLAR